MKISPINFKGHYVKDGYYIIDKKDKGVIQGGTLPRDNMGEHSSVKKISEINPYYSVSQIGDCLYINYN